MIGHDLNVDIVMCIRKYMHSRADCTIMADQTGFVKVYVPEGWKTKVCNHVASRFKRVPLKEIEKCVMEFVEDE